MLDTIRSQGHAQRIIDFCYGLTKGLDGHLNRVSAEVFIITPYNYAPVFDVTDIQNNQEQAVR
jgi:FtsZ-interacting cell division protein YlmF